MKFSNEFHNEVKSISKAVAREWADVTDFDDLHQDVWVRICSSSDKYLDELLNMESSRRMAILRTLAQRSAQQSRNDFEVFNGNFRYASHEVRFLLEHEVIVKQPPDIVTATIRSDLDKGLTKLAERNSQYYAILVNKYIHGIQPANGAERMNLTRAVDKLTSYMNGSHRQSHVEWQEKSGPGSRKVMSNNAAQYVTESRYVS